MLLYLYIVGLFIIALFVPASFGGRMEHSYHFVLNFYGKPDYIFMVYEVAVWSLVCWTCSVLIKRFRSK